METAIEIPPFLDLEEHLSHLLHSRVYRIVSV